MTEQRKQRKREYDRLYKKKLYNFMRERGMCPKCNKEEVVPGKFLCARCALNHAGYNVVYYDNKKSKHQCVKCNKPTNGHVYCDECLEQRRMKSKALRDNRIAQGLCPKCGGERSDTTRIYCEKCREKIAINQAANRRAA